MAEKKFRPMMTPAQKKAREKQDKKMGISEDTPYFYNQSVEFNTEQLPEIKNWKVGEHYELTIKVRMQSYEDRKVEKKKNKNEARFELVAVKSNSKGSKMKKEQDKISAFMKDDVGKTEEE